MKYTREFLYSGKPEAQVLFCPIQNDQWERRGQASL